MVALPLDWPMGHGPVNVQAAEFLGALPFVPGMKLLGGSLVVHVICLYFSSSPLKSKRT